MRSAPLRRSLAILFAAAVFVGACSSDSGDEVDTGDDSTSTDTVDGEDTDTGTDPAATGDETGDETGEDAGASADGTVDGGDVDAGADAGAGSDPAAPPADQGAQPADPAPAPKPNEQAAPPANNGSQPGAPVIPKAGTYTYSRTTTSEEGTETNDTDVVVERLSGDDSKARLRFTLDSDQGRLTNDADVTPTETIVDITVIDSPLGQVTCDWDPNWRLNGPLSVGSEWSYESSCDDDLGGVQVHVELSGTGKVVGFETIEVNGESINAWVVETTTKTDTTVSSPTINGKQKSDSSGRSWIDPKRGLSVKSTSHDEMEGDFGSGTSDSTQTLKAFKA